MRTHSWIRWYTAAFMDDPSGFNPKRRLCPDGACIGIIGPDGRCGECGRGGGSESSGTDIFAVLDASEVDDGFTGTADVSEESPAAVSFDASGASVPGSGFDPSRRLCQDGTCVGVIGPQGVCTVCGAPG